MTTKLCITQKTFKSSWVHASSIDQSEHSLCQSDHRCQSLALGGPLPPPVSTALLWPSFGKRKATPTILSGALPCRLSLKDILPLMQLLGHTMLWPSGFFLWPSFVGTCFPLLSGMKIGELVPNPLQRSHPRVLGQSQHMICLGMSL